MKKRTDKLYKAAQAVYRRKTFCGPADMADFATQHAAQVEADTRAEVLREVLGQIRYTMNSFAYRPGELGVIEACLKRIESGGKTFSSAEFIGVSEAGKLEGGEDD